MRNLRSTSTWGVRRRPVARPCLFAVALTTVAVALALSSSAFGTSPGIAVAAHATSFHDGLVEELQLHARVTDTATCAAAGIATYSNTVFGSYEGTVVGMTFFGSRTLVVIRIDMGTGVFANPSFPFAILHITDGGPPEGGGDTMSGNTILGEFIPSCFEIGPATFFSLSSGNIIIR